MCAKWWHDRFWVGITCIPNLFEKILFRGESTFHINKWRSYIRKRNGMFIGWGGMACQTVMSEVELMREAVVIVSP